MIKKTTLTLLACLFAGTAFAETNIAVVDFEAVIGQSTRARAALSQVGLLRREKQTELQAMADNFTAKKSTAEAQAATMTESARREANNELQRLQTEIQRKQEDYEREVQRRTALVLEDLGNQLTPVVHEIAVERGIQLVLQYRAELGIVFVDDALDLTDEVVARFDSAQ